MNTQIKKCQNCKGDFQIEPEDFDFYKKMDVSAPKLCSDCRYQRRLAHRNERVLYHRESDATDKDIIAIYPQDTAFPVYEQKYWNSGEWDAIKYGRDFDFSLPFFEQFKRLQQVVPRINLKNYESINSEYTNQAEHNKNCYLLVASSYNENVMYGNWAQSCKDSMDIYNLLEGEQSYEVINCQKASRVFWCMSVENSFNCWFSYDLKGCSNCFLSSNLRNKSYYWENKPLSKDEWEKRFREVDVGGYASTERLKKRWYDVMEQALHKFAIQSKITNSTGDMLFECKNVVESFNMSRAEDCKYCQDGLEMKDCWDNTEVAFKFERCYEVHGSAHVSRSLFCNICWESYELYYCDLCNYSSHLFGCIALKHKKYCILNKQHSKQEYEKLKDKIIRHMKDTGEWGEFFPIKVSPFAYNETTALEYFPLSKEEVLTRGWRWQDEIPVTYDKGTIKAEDIADNIKDVSDNIIHEVLTCTKCGRNYQIIEQELTFYKGMNLPLPRLCLNCRHYTRLALRNPRKLWHRTCQCAGDQSDNKVYKNTVDHFHKQSHCPNEFQTTYSPKRSEIVYCEQCYQSEVV